MPLRDSSPSSAASAIPTSSGGSHTLVARLWRRLTEPPTSLRSSEDRTRARLLSVLSLASFAAVGCVEIAFRLASPRYAIDWLVLAMAAGSYLLGRRGHVRGGGLLLAYALPLDALVRVGTSAAFDPLVPLTALVLSLLLAAMVLSRREVLVLLAVEMAVPPALVAVVPSAFPQPAIIAAPMALTAVVGVLVLAFMRQRDILEAVRQHDLRASEARFRALVANVPGVVYRVADGPERRAVYVSDGVRDLVGFGPEAFLGPEARTLDDLIHADDRERVRAERDRSRRERRPYVLEYRLVGALGVRWVLDRGREAPEEGDGADGVLIDVSLREAAVAETQRLAAIVEATSDFVAMAHPDGRLRYINRAGRALLGWGDDEDVASRGIGDTHSPEALEFVETEAIPAAVRRGVWAGETALKTRDGREVPVSQVIVAHRSSSGDLEFLSTIMRDLSERAAAEAAARESEERFRLLASAAFEGIAITAEGRVVDANERLAEMLGLPRAELIGRPVMDFVAPEFRESVLDHQRRGSEEPYEHLARRADGTLFPVEACARTIPSRGGSQRVTALLDLTERKRAEEERLALERRAQHGQKLEGLGVLAGGIAHDFNNLLVAVLGNLDLALASLAEDAPQRRHLEQAEHAAQQGAGLARELLAYSGRGRFVVSSLDLTALVEEMGQLLRAAIHKTIRLELRLERPTPPILADASQLQQVVMNLIVNAAEAIGERNGTITLTTGVDDCGPDVVDRSRLQVKPPPGRFARLEVTDDGCGMTPEVQDRLFDPFFSTKLAGRGLGMAAVQGIVQGHGGAVLVDSAPGAGTTFRVFFPLTNTAAEEASPVSRGGTARGRFEHGGLVLIADDEDVVREATQKMVEHLGFSVVAAADGREAIELFRRVGEQVVFVLLDLTMPALDGPATLVELRRLRPDVKILLASGFDKAEMAGRCGTERPDGYLQKPYRLANLREAVEAALFGGSPGD